MAEMTENERHIYRIEAGEATSLEVISAIESILAKIGDAAVLPIKELKTNLTAEKIIEEMKTPFSK